MSGPRPVVISGPSGAGKSTLLKKLLKDYKGVFGFSVSRTYCVTQHVVSSGSGAGSIPTVSALSNYRPFVIVLGVWYFCRPLIFKQFFNSLVMAVLIGARQGYPLSPFHFLMAIDWITRKTTEHKRNGIQLGLSGMSLNAHHWLRLLISFCIIYDMYAHRRRWVLHLCSLNVSLQIQQGTHVQER